MDVEPSIFGSSKDSWRYKKTKGDSNDQIYWQAIGYWRLDPFQRWKMLQRNYARLTSHLVNVSILSTGKASSFATREMGTVLISERTRRSELKGFTFACMSKASTYGLGRSTYDMDGLDQGFVSLMFPV